MGCKYSNKCLEIAKIIVLTCKRNNPTTIHLEHKNWNVKEDNIKEVVAVDETALEVTEDPPDPEEGPGEDGQDGDGTSVGPLPFEGWKGAQ